MFEALEQALVSRVPAIGEEADRLMALWAVSPNVSEGARLIASLRTIRSVLEKMPPDPRSDIASQIIFSMAVECTAVLPGDDDAERMSRRPAA